MFDVRLVKKWKPVEVQLNLASNFLLEKNAFHVPEQCPEEYRYNLREHELCHAMIALEETARRVGAKSGFWRAIKRAAETIGDTNKVKEYEREFHKALSKNV
jgi:hypothetical protein